jgi:hypothetical protein
MCLNLWVIYKLEVSVQMAAFISNISFMSLCQNFMNQTVQEDVKF